MKMKNLKRVLRDAIEMAKETGLWQMLTIHEKKELITFFYSEFTTSLEKGGKVCR